jgi:hypothetical protein
MNKRSLLKGMLGGAVAGPDAMRQATQYTGRSPYPPPPSDILNVYPTNSPLGEVFDAVAHEARKLVLKQIDDNRELLWTQINHQICAIKRQKSTSEAYKDFMIAKLEQERSNVFKRAEQLMNAAWGYKSDGPQQSPR